MTTTQKVLDFQHTSATVKHTLKSLNQPADLFNHLYRRKFGLGIVAGTDIVEIRKTLVAIANEFEGYRGSIGFRSPETEPLPGVTELAVTDMTAEPKRIMKNGLTSWLVIMDAVDTVEKLEFATYYASIGATIIAPVLSSSMDETFAKLREVGQYVSPYSFAHSLTYIAQQDLVEGRSLPDGGMNVVTKVKVIDEAFRNSLVAFK